MTASIRKNKGRKRCTASHSFCIGVDRREGKEYILIQIENFGTKIPGLHRNQYNNGNPIHAGATHKRGMPVIFFETEALILEKP